MFSTESYRLLMYKVYFCVWVGMGWDFNISADVINHFMGKPGIGTSVTLANYEQSWRMGNIQEGEIGANKLRGEEIKNLP